MSTLSRPKHIGRNISRIRELRDMKQEALAQALGTSQQTISAIENSETIDDAKLEEVAKALGVTPEGIKNYSDENILSIINNTFNSHDSSTLNAVNFQPTFNPLDKVVELYQEKEKLYERLIQTEKDKVEYLEKIVKGK
ncbi:helix-turn-helix domain-containing protein [Flavobacterium johnsoniae]|uniref:Transcriptional regulator, XRE family n=1 Tax=Flavobacterium johnsoniae (strain ATCC 17061 / DSM 2064 / JCM 8514 / BCRC 14874 / CCUG 350202 / NBRC 14942 / NCIMB 11054 / UW101) TaxID=376686 RepID=A5FMR3_FLAJ1|nr:helix-turn-helix transcriptional regulator [Flavobacterium johnsoniae]ABQ03501.1 transcriptional regulator, XRE family [Flavobacterium johnsoniae UW101]OXE97108.1 transcriptional regulator [Flavobacterium johnsoniae UW101]WQG79636.1 helix-turn-helix transcriptional regulator [Flavobacterium johnsoniae UW101]SHL73300.1 DNA-binding transcriptional regulator, XRE-family HTH domain [Flavobacterium johnsoniae]